MRRGESPAQECELALRELALRYPESHEDFPWDHRAIKVRKKIFVTLGTEGDSVRVTVKLPDSQADALELPDTEPTHYGMGKHGWVTAEFRATDKTLVALLGEWIDESYRTVAPKKLVKQLPEAGPPAGS